MRLCGLVAQRAGTQVLLPSTAIGGYCASHPVNCCALSSHHFRARAACGCSGTCHLPDPYSLCDAAWPGRAPTRFTCSPSSDCSSCQVAPCKLTLSRPRIWAITSAWHPALLALTGVAWTCTSWVSRRVRWIPPGLPLLQPSTAHGCHALPQSLLPSHLGPPTSPCWLSSQPRWAVTPGGPLSPTSGGRRMVIP